MRGEGTTSPSPLVSFHSQIESLGGILDGTEWYQKDLIYKVAGILYSAQQTKNVLPADARRSEIVKYPCLINSSLSPTFTIKDKYCT